MPDDRGDALLEASRRLRVLDDAAILIRRELDDLHDMTAQLPPYRALPPALHRRLMVTAERLEQIDTELEEALALLALIAEDMSRDGDRVIDVLREEAKLSLVPATIPEPEPIPDRKDPAHVRPLEGDRPL